MPPKQNTVEFTTKSSDEEEPIDEKIEQNPTIEHSKDDNEDDNNGDRADDTDDDEDYDDDGDDDDDYGPFSFDKLMGNKKLENIFENFLGHQQNMEMFDNMTRFLIHDGKNIAEHISRLTEAVDRFTNVVKEHLST